MSSTVVRGIVDYQVATAPDSLHLRQSVADLLSWGWQPWGNLVITPDPAGYLVYAQPMVKYAVERHGNAEPL
jgi:hypothetical protein